MTEFATDAIDKLDAFLRSIAPGFVLLAVLIAVDPAETLGVARLFSGNEWNGIGLGILLGIVSYAIHLSVLEDCWMRPVLRLVRIFYSDDIPPKPFPIGSPRKVIPILTRERWARRASENQQVRAFQDGLNKAYPWLIFLYCTGYLLRCGSFMLLWRSNSENFKAWMVLVGGLSCLISAVLTDAKITRHELWLLKKSPEVVIN